MKGLSLPHHLGPFVIMHATGILSRIRRSTKPRNRTSHCECLSFVHLNIARHCNARSRHTWHHFPDVTVQNSWESVQASPYRPVTEYRNAEAQTTIVQTCGCETDRRSTRRFYAPSIAYCDSLISATRYSGAVGCATGFLLILPSLCTCTLVLPPICTLVSVDGFCGDIFRASSQIVRTHLSVLAPEEAVSSTASREVRHPNSSFYTSDMTEGQIWEKTGYCPEWTGLPMEIMISSKAGFDEGSLPCIRVCGTYEEGCAWGMLTHLSASLGIIFAGYSGLS